MQPLFFLLLVIPALILQTTAFDYIAIYGVKPDLVMILVIINGFLRGPREGAFLGFAAGILQDLVSGGYFGLNALAQMTSGYLAGLGEGRLYRDNRVIAAGLTWVCTLGAQLVFQLLLLLVNVSVPVPAALAYVILPTAFYNALVVLVIYGYFYRFARKDQSNNGDFF